MSGQGRRSLPEMRTTLPASQRANTVTIVVKSINGGSAYTGDSIVLLDALRFVQTEPVTDGPVKKVMTSWAEAEKAEKIKMMSPVLMRRFFLFSFAARGLREREGPIAPYSSAPI